MTAMQVRSNVSMSSFLASRMTEIQAHIQKVEQQVSTQQKAASYAELGTQASVDIALHNERNSVDNYHAGNTILIARMSAMDQAMLAIHDAAEAVKSDAYALTPTDSQRTALINKAAGALASVINALQVAVGGRELFSGDATGSPAIKPTTMTDLQAALTTPTDATIVATDIATFFAGATNFYGGGAALKATAIDQNLTVDYGIEASNAAFVDLLQGLATIALAPKPDGVVTTDATYATAIQGAAQKLTSGVGQVNALISANGSNQALVTSANEQHALTLTMLKSQINDLEMTDLTEAASQISMLRTQLEATYSMTAQLNRLTLLDYMR